MSEHKSAPKPQVSHSKSQQEIDRADAEFKKFDEEVKSMTLDRMNAAPKSETEEPKLSQKEIAKSNDIYLKPDRTIASKEPFNEKYRDEFNFQKEYVNFTATNNEIIGENIEKWTKAFPGQPAEFWKIPTNKPVWGPRYVAESLKKCSYHVFSMDERQVVGADGMGSYTGRIVVDSIKQRLDAHPVSQRKSVFMGASGF
jgi:hypothetical protein